MAYRKTFLNGHCPPWGNRQCGPFFSRQKRHLSAYYGIKFQLKMMMKIMNMMMILNGDNFDAWMMTMPKYLQLP